MRLDSPYCHSPIILLIFKRPELTKKVFSKIRTVKPKQLFIIADGPRNSGEQYLCKQTRAITEQVDWDCEVYRNYADSNLGCRKRISSGISWAFKYVKEAIILEDDCLPDVSFFSYCENLLNHYRHDERVMAISGDNFQDGRWRGDGSYYFSYYPHCWGWATWKRAWIRYDDNLSKWQEFKQANLLGSLFVNHQEVQYWTSIFDQLKSQNKPDSWAYRWAYSCWINSGLTILPNVNLVRNVGFGDASTNTHDPKNPFANLPAKTITKEIRHPSFIVRDHVADSYTFEHMFNRKSFNLVSRTLIKLAKSAENLIQTRY